MNPTYMRLGMAGAICLGMSMGASAAFETVDGVEWHYETTNGEAVVCGWVEDLGSYGVQYSAIDTATAGNVAIPSRLGGCPVTIIDIYAFVNCSRLTSIGLPGSVREIRRFAFGACHGLTSLELPAGVTEIEAGAFCMCSRLASIQVAAGNPRYHVADGVLCDGDRAEILFCPEGRQGPFEVPDGILGVAAEAFEDCTGLTGIHFPVGLSTIGSSAFAGCDSLQTVSIPGTVETVGTKAFSGCAGLKELILGDGVSTVESNAFENCTGLASVAIPASVEWIGGNTFHGCSFVEEATMPGKFRVKEILGGSYGKIERIHIAPGETTVVNLFCDGCTNLASVTIPDSVERMGKTPFRGCGKLPKDTSAVPGCELVDGWAIACGTNHAGRVDLRGVRGVAAGAFSGCPKVTSVALPEGLRSIGPSTFAQCSGLTELEIPSGVEEIGENAFSGCWRWTGPAQIPGGVETIGNYAFSQCSNLSSAVMAEGVKEVGKCAFAWCAKLDEAILPESVEAIGNQAFWQCAALGSVCLGPSAKAIGEEAFGCCTRLKTVEIPSGTTSVGKRAFYQCGGLEEVTLPASLTMLGKELFLGCGNIATVYLEEGSPLSAADLSAAGIPGESTVKTLARREVNGAEWTVCVEDGEAKVRKVTPPASGWLQVPEDIGEWPVVKIDKAAFSECGGVTMLVLPAGVAEIGTAALRHCPQLETLYLHQYSPITEAQLRSTLRLADTCEIVRWTSANPPVPVTHTVALDTQGGLGGTSSVEVRTGGALPTVDIPEREHWTFLGYWSERGGGGTQYYRADGKGAEVWDKESGATLYADWSAKTTTGTPEPVPEWWLAQQLEVLAAAGGDYEAAAAADWDGDGAAAWEEYVAGTSPEDKGDVFRVTGWTWEGGEMVPEYGPKDEETRTYTVEAADEAGGAYKPTSGTGAAEGRRFYRVRVEMK